MSVSLEIDGDGTKFWFSEEGFLHREDGPAIEYTDGSYEYHINGIYHRTNGPATKHFISALNAWLEEWFINGIRHREDGPALIHPDGTKFWFYKGKLIDVSSQEEFERLLNLKAFL